MKSKKVNWLIIDDKKNQELLPIEDTIKIIRKSTKLSIKSPEMIQDRQKDNHRIRVFKDKWKIIKIIKIGILCRVEISHKIKVGKRYETLINQEWKGNIDSFNKIDKVISREEEKR
jgi:hypothetical protein